MQYSFILNVALFVSSALSKPAALTPLNDRIARRRGGSHHGGLPKIVGTSAGTSDGTYNVAASAPAAKVANVIQYSSNWAGAVLLAPPVAGTMFNSVLGTFTVPTPSVPTGGKVGTYAASLWVGIDGDTAQQSSGKPALASPQSSHLPAKLHSHMIHGTSGIPTTLPTSPLPNSPSRQATSFNSLSRLPQPPRDRSSSRT